MPPETIESPIDTKKTERATETNLPSEQIDPINNSRESVKTVVSVKCTSETGEANEIKRKIYWLLYRAENEEAQAYIKQCEDQGINCAKAIKALFIDYINSAEHGSAERLRKYCGKNIDFTKEFKFLQFHYLKKGEFFTSLRIYDDFGHGVDCSSIPGYADAVKSTFLRALEECSIDSALQIRSRFGQGIDFTAEIRAGFLALYKKLNKPIASGHLKLPVRFEDLMDFEGAFGKEIDLSPEITQVFMKDFEAHVTWDRSRILFQCFQEKVNFSPAIKRAFTNQMEAGNSGKAMAIQGIFDPEKKVITDSMISEWMDNAVNS